MKDFQTVVVNNQRYDNAIGSYYRDGSYLVVEAENSECEDIFSKLLDDRVIINLIKFEDQEDTIGMFSGPYLIRLIENNVITLIKP